MDAVLEIDHRDVDEEGLYGFCILRELHKMAAPDYGWEYKETNNFWVMWYDHGFYSCGKFTSMLKALKRLYQMESGEIQLNDI